MPVAGIHKQALTNVSALNTTSAPIDSQGSASYTLSTVAGTGVSGGSIVLEGSPNSTDWFVLVTNAHTAPGILAASSSGPHRYLRCRVSAALVGGTISAWITAGGAIGGPAGNWIPGP